MFQYSKNDFVFKINVNEDNESDFDKSLKKLWSEKVQNDCFRYKLKIEEKKLGEKFKFISQLNTNRATNRRPAAELTFSQPFNHNEFNFTKIKEQEVIFKLRCLEENYSSEEDDNVVAINVSPIEHGHILLLPSLHKCLTQFITHDGLKATIEMVLLSHSANFRAGFNGICAFATVNHLHFHGYYLPHRMLLETIKVEHVNGLCYKVNDFPSKGFVFQLRSEEEIQIIVADICKLTNYFKYNNIAHNLHITRGLTFEKSEIFPNPSEADERDCVRIYVWARQICRDAKKLSAFSPALCEFFGHLCFKNEHDFNTYTEEMVANELEKLTKEIFDQILPDVIVLYES